MACECVKCFNTQEYSSETERQEGRLRNQGVLFGFTVHVQERNKSKYMFKINRYQEVLPLYWHGVD